MRKQLRHGTVRLISNASHAINGEHPAEIAAELGRFLDATEQSASQ